MKPAFYNEIDPYCAAWLRNLIKAGLIPDGEVDERDIRSVELSDLSGFNQCHFFAGIGGFGLACRLARIPDDEQIWTGGFPCQPFSVAGRQLAQEDDRHLWPVLSRLIEQARPPVFVGENVAGIIDLALDGVLFDLESAGYASRAFVVPACAVNAPHRRDRVWIAACRMADTTGEGRVPTPLAGVHGGEAGARPRHGEFERHSRGSDSVVAHSGSERQHRRESVEGNGRGSSIGSEAGNNAGDCGTPYFALGNPDSAGSSARDQSASPSRYRRPAIPADWASPWSGAEYRTGADGKARRVEPRIRLLSSGISGRVAKLRAAGNAIVPQVAAEIIKAVMAVRP